MSTTEKNETNKPRTVESIIDDGSVDQSSEGFVSSPFHFLEMLVRDGVGVEQWSDVEGSMRRQFLKDEIEARTFKHLEIDADQKFSSQFVVQEAAARFFSLLRPATVSMNGLFTIKDLTKILNTTCGPIWDWEEGCMSVFSMVVDDNGINSWSDVSKDSEMEILMKKLKALTPLQNAALVDVCERFWREKRGSSLEDSFEEMGLILKE